MRKLVKKIIMLVASVSLICCSFGNVQYAFANENEINIQDSYNSKEVDKHLQKVGFTKKEIKNSNYKYKMLLYRALKENAYESKVIRNMSHLLHSNKGEIYKFLKKKKINHLEFIGYFIVSVRNSGDTNKGMYKTFRHFKASKKQARRMSRIIINELSWL